MLGHLAFAIVIAIVIARGLMLETVRDSTSTDTIAPVGPGAATSIVLDWLSFVPALLLLARRAIDREFSLRLGAVHVLLGLLAAWTLASVGWADDRFAALIESSRIAGGTALFWAASQIATRWSHLRVVVGVVVGLLLVNVMQGALYQNVELADTQTYFRTNKQQILAEHGWREGEYVAERFEMKVMAGEMLNFSISANVLGALAVTAALVALGAGMQRLEDRDDRGWAGAMFLAAAGSLYVLAYTESKSSRAALALGIVLIAAWRILRHRLARHRTLAFSLGIAAIGIGLAGLIALGITRHGLPSDSLNFRWRYWVGSWPLVLERPMLGVGWANFADAYLRHRLPVAAEEIQDPHSFPVRWLVELGVVGLVLGVAWLIAWAWRATRVLSPSPGTPMRVSRVLWACALALALTLACTIDLTGDGNYATLEIMRRSMFVGLIALAMGLACIGPRASADSPFFVDERPAPWLAAAAFVGVLMLLLQSTIDMALFQPGPWSLAMLVMGSLAGLYYWRASLRDAVAIPPVPPKRQGLPPSIVLAVFALAWISAGVVVGRVVIAESYVQRGDTALGRRRVEDAWRMYQYATYFSPVSNWDYALKEARAFEMYIASANGAIDTPAYTPRELYGRAIDAAPRHAMSWLTRARHLASRKDVSPADAQQAIDDFGHGVSLNPNDVDLRLEFADLLERFGRRAEAAEQLEMALELDDQLDPAEPERLELRSPGKRERIRSRAAALRGAR